MTTVGVQLFILGIDLGAPARVNATFSVHCDRDQECRYSAIRVRSLTKATEAARRHEADRPGHRCRVIASVDVPIASVWSAVPAAPRFLIAGPASAPQCAANAPARWETHRG